MTSEPRRYRAILFSLGKRAEASKGTRHSPAGRNDVFPHRDMESASGAIPLLPNHARLLLFLVFFDHRDRIQAMVKFSSF